MSWKIREALWLALAAAPAREVVFHDGADHVVAPAGHVVVPVENQRLPPVANAVSDHGYKEFAMLAQFLTRY
jgi:hypothetical protein